MRLLADEGFDHRVIDALRKAGHDVDAASAIARGAKDAQVLDMARQGGQILLTEDRDFGQLVFASEIGDPIGVIYVRCTESERTTLAARIVALVDRHGPSLQRSFIVWTPRRTRMRPYRQPTAGGQGA